MKKGETDTILISLTIFFEEPFWIGVCERKLHGKLAVCKVTFGEEPKDYEVLNFILKSYFDLVFSPEIAEEKKQKEKVNPKRIQRDTKRQIQKVGIGTKSQMALKLQQKQNKTLRKVKSKEQKNEEKLERYSLKQLKKREKHRGR